jgi:hypothetical protein
MIDQTQGLDNALNQLAEILSRGRQGGGSTGPLTPPPGQPAGTPINPPNGGPVVPPPAGGFGGLSAAQRAEIARLAYYWQGMPVLTPERCRELEDGLPALLALLKSLSHRPALKRQLMDMAQAANQQVASGNRSEAQNARAKALGELMAADVTGADPDERVVQLVALGVAVVVGSYMITHSWGR